uniref:Uncharacterized protein n=1 Tax=Candidatus Kentrum sp. MB TaxID=2138164 RepID=A0A450Y2H5_9GAMM|nr:MAG: hypothetical protein BECKMB1821I_GA0114274_11412 [Candidatus Kentron sp. MB]VFK77341.1 MAG: hypothetical protein BECKMB1821H_GA0114242_11262 [Candidatus Kentron sp. MB]
MMSSYFDVQFGRAARGGLPVINQYQDSRLSPQLFSIIFKLENTDVKRFLSE